MSTPERQSYEFGPYRLDTAERLLLRDGEPLPLTPKAFDTLVALVERNGHLVAKDELMKAVWPGSFVEESNLTNNVYALRKLLGRGEDGQSYIETVPTRGYRFRAAVTEQRPGELVVEKRTLTRIVTEEREEEARQGDVAPGPIDRARAKNAGRATRWREALLALSLIVVAVGGVGLYRLTALRTPRPGAAVIVPFGAMDISRLTTSGTITRAAISPNGKYLANVVKDAEGHSLWVKHLEAPSNVRVAGPAMTEIISVAFAPGGDVVHYVALDYDKGESTLYKVPVLGGRAEVVAHDIYPIGFSADGRQIAFIRMRKMESTLVVADADGSNQRVVASRQKPDFFELEWNAPAWSPDGKTIACPVSLNDERGRYGTIVGVNPADGTQTPLTAERWNYVGQPVWLPDGAGVLVAASDRPGSPMQVWHVGWPGGAATRITRDVNNYHDLSLTADGSRLAAVQVQEVSNIWVAPVADASRARQVGSEIGALDVLAWTSDGRIVYRSSAGGSGADIWIMNADGSDARQLTVGARASRGLAVTPDGRHVVFVSDRAGRFNLWRVDTDGGNLRQLTAGDGEFYPQSSPDGQWVVFQSGEVDPRLWKVPTTGGQPVPLTATRAAKPAVSPDGRKIAYSYLDLELRPSRWGIGIISAEGGPLLNRFDFPPAVVSRAIGWSPDGRSIAFVNNAGGRSDIWLQPLDGTPPAPLTSFRAEQILTFEWSPDGRSLGYVRHVQTSDAVLIERAGRGR